MRNLQLTITNSDREPHSQTYTFSNEGADADSAPHLEFVTSDFVHCGTSRVYKGTLTDGIALCMCAVCKLVESSPESNPAWLVNEAGIYTENLADLQGICIPRFYGLFFGEISGNKASCIILEDCGVALKDYFDAYPIELRIKVMRILMALHKRGVQHRDFGPRNVVVDNLDNPTRVNIIDFAASTYRHICPFGMQLALYALPKGEQCQEIYRVALDLQLMTSPYVQYMGSLYKVTTVRNAEGLVHAGPKPIVYTPEQLLEAAHYALASYFDQYGENADYVTGKKKQIIGPLL